MNHAKAMGLAIAYNMYKECAERGLDVEWKVEKPVLYHKFHNHHKAWQQLQLHILCGCDIGIAGTYECWGQCCPVGTGGRQCMVGCLPCHMLLVVVLMMRVLFMRIV
jgi:hypothetical protein